METELHENLICSTKDLQDLLAGASTNSIVGMFANFFFSSANSLSESSELMSPSRQPFFVLGLMLTTKEPDVPKEFGQKEWNKCVDLANKIYSFYADMFWPKANESDALTEDWKETRQVAMPAFLHYFNCSPMATVEQNKARIQRYLIPFDAQLTEGLGISGTEALNISDWIIGRLNSSINELHSNASAEEKVRRDMLGKAQSEGWNIDRIRKEAQSEGYMPLAQKLFESLDNIFKIKFMDLSSKFGEKLSGAYWELFVARRGEMEEFFYLTENNTAEEKPLYETDKNVALCPMSNALFSSILVKFENFLTKKETKESFLKKRDNLLEEETESLVRKIFGSTANYYSKLYETKFLQNEHDLIVKWKKKIFIFEAKASPPKEPFRNPDQAYTRIKRHFKSDCGIQKAYDQGISLKKN